METVSSAKLTKASKQHMCDFCGEIISIGEKYMKSTHVDDHIYDWKAHVYCDKLSHTLKLQDECQEGVTAECFQEYVSENHLTILTDQLPNDDAKKYSDIFNQLTKVKFRDKLWFVIRHFNKLKELI